MKAVGALIAGAVLAGVSGLGMPGGATPGTWAVEPVSSLSGVASQMPAGCAIAVSADASVVWFVRQTGVSATGPVFELVRHDRRTGTEVVVGPASCGLGLASSADGNRVAWSASSGMRVRDLATNLDLTLPSGVYPNLSADGTILAYREQVAGSVLRLVSLPGGEVLPSPVGADDSYLWFISSDGRYVALTTFLGLDPADRNGVRDPYVWDRITGAYDWIAVARPAGAGSAPVFARAISGDGRFVAVAIGASEYGVYDRASRTLTPVSVGGITAMSDNGQRVVSAGWSQGVEVTDIDDGRMWKIVGPWSMSESVMAAAFSADGSALAFATPHALDPADTNNRTDVYIATFKRAVGYWTVDSEGRVYAYGSAPKLSLGGPTVAIASAPHGGFYALRPDGSVVGVGGATSDPQRLLLSGDERFTTLAGHPVSGGWRFTSKGRVFGFPLGPLSSGPPSYGDTVNLPLNGPIIASVATRTGRGYWMIASDGGIFAFGDAKFHGSMGGKPLNEPVVGMIPDPDGTGYWLVAADGGVFAFDAPFVGSVPGVLPPGVRLNRPVIGGVAYGNGYALVASDGGVFVFSDLPFLGSSANTFSGIPMIGLAVSSS